MSITLTRAGAAGISSMPRALAGHPVPGEPGTLGVQVFVGLLLPLMSALHPDHAADVGPAAQVPDGLIDAVEVIPSRDQLLDLELAGQVELEQADLIRLRV